MKCNSCHTVNDDKAQFCFNCGHSFKVKEQEISNSGEHTIRLLLTILGIQYAIVLFWFFIQKVFSRFLFKKDGYYDFDEANKVFDFLNICLESLVIIMFLIIAFMSKHKGTRIVLILLAIVKLFVAIGYRFIPGPY